MPSFDVLRERYQSISVTAGGAGLLFGAGIPGRPRDYVGKGADGEPLLLLAVSCPSGFKPGLRLRHISVDYGASCRIQDERSTEQVEGIFTVISCASDDPGLYEFFLTAASWVLTQLPLNPSQSEIQRHIESLVELFRKLSIPSAKSLKGLWAELFVIWMSGNTDAWLKAWHRDGFEKFDFAWTGVRLDVKASERPQRIHEFALSQLSAQGANRAVIVSLLLRRTAGGLGITDLASKLVADSATGSGHIDKLLTNIAETLGGDFVHALDIKFDPDFARDSLRVIDATLIPRPAVVDSRVFDVRFWVDVDDVARMSRSKLEGLGP